MKEIFVGKTIEEAKEKAAVAFGASQNDIVYRILEEPKKGLFGKVKREAQVEAIYEPVEEAPAPTPTPTPASTPAMTEPAVDVSPVADTLEPAAETGAVVGPDAASIGIELEEVESVLPDEELTPGLKKAKQYVIDIYAKMGVTLEVSVLKTKSGIRMELTSSAKSGTIIGRRGETLDSVQYLASIIANKDSEEYCRMMLDSNGYREKRRTTLEQLADKISRNVLRSGRSTTLEPMNPYERRIIHSRIAEIEGVTSRSVGEDPYRKVVISSTVAPQQRRGGYRDRGGNGGRRGGHRPGGRRPYQNRDRRERRPEDFQRKDLDSMKTSFERDYKKPKPEDELNAGLYGKIEF